MGGSSFHTGGGGKELLTSGFRSALLSFQQSARRNAAKMQDLTGPLNQLNASLSLLHSVNRQRTLSAMGSAIGRRYLALSCLLSGLFREAVFHHGGVPEKELMGRFPTLMGRFPT